MSNRSNVAAERGRIGGLIRRNATLEQIERARAELAVAHANADLAKVPQIVDDAIARGASPVEAVRAAVKILTAYGESP